MLPHTSLRLTVPMFGVEVALGAKQVGSRRERRAITPVFKAEAVPFCGRVGWTLALLGRDLEIGRDRLRV